MIPDESSRDTIRASSTSTDELDAAILAALSDSGGLAAWSDLRGQLPAASHRAKAEALVRLDDAGLVDAVKVDGRTFVGLPIEYPLRWIPA